MAYHAGEILRIPIICGKLKPAIKMRTSYHISLLMFQALILKKYPAGLIVVFFYCFFVAIQSAVVSLVLERDLSSWSLQPNTRLIAVLYSVIKLQIPP